MRVSHGCVRLYPENIEFLYTLVDIGESVTILNDPYQMGRNNGALYFEAHTALEDDTVPAQDRLDTLLDAELGLDELPLNDHLKAHIRSLSETANGIPVNIVMYDAGEILARARVVQNIVARDPNEPTLSEVREMMDELVAEEGEENGK
jgi:hypothetical protein